MHVSARFYTQSSTCKSLLFNSSFRARIILPGDMYIRNAYYICIIHFISQKQFSIHRMSVHGLTPRSNTNMLLQISRGNCSKIWTSDFICISINSLKQHNKIFIFIFLTKKAETWPKLKYMCTTGYTDVRHTAV